MKRICFCFLPFPLSKIPVLSCLWIFFRASELYFAFEESTLILVPYTHDNNLRHTRSFCFNCRRHSTLIFGSKILVSVQSGRWNLVPPSSLRLDPLHLVSIWVYVSVYCFHWSNSIVGSTPLISSTYFFWRQNRIPVTMIYRHHKSSGFGDDTWTTT